MIGWEFVYIVEVYFCGYLVGDGFFIWCSYVWFEQQIGCCKVLFIFLCIVVLEMMVLFLDIEEGDEVILLLYIFVFIVNVFVLCGGVLVFVDIWFDMFNIDEICIVDVIIL